LKLLSIRNAGRDWIPAISRGEIAIWSLISFLAAYAGPFGTFSHAFGHRLVYWSLVVVVSALMANAFARLSRRLVGRGRPVLADLVLVALMALFFTPVLLGLTRFVLSEQPASLSEALRFGQFVAIVSLGVTSSRRVLSTLFSGGGRLVPDDTIGEATARPKGAPPQPRLMRRLPEEFDGPILRLSSKDHFVDVVGSDDRHRLRMRLSDAVDEMDPVEGYCTHRSHWVAREAVAAAERDGARLLLRLTNGDTVPVSRTYREDLERAGLL